jgi:heptosyltransferase-1
LKVLIVKTSSLGDIIHTFPVLQFLHEKHPGVSVDWVVEAPFAELVRAHPLVNQVFPVDTKKWRKAVNLKLLVKFARDLRKTRYDVLFDF